MKNYYKKRYALSEQGAKNLTKATIYCFLTYCINLGPMFILMGLINQLVLGNVSSTLQYIVMAILTLVFMYILLSEEYVSLYNSTYKESANLRKGIAENLAQLPLAYFSKHDLSDLSQTIMSDVERVEHSMSHSIPKVVAMWLFFPLMGLIMLIGNWKLGLAAIIPTLLSFMINPLAKQKEVSEYSRYFNVLRDNSELFQETIELQQEISSFNQADKVKKNLYKKMEESERIHLNVEIVPMLAVGISSSLSYISLAVVLAVGIQLLIHNEISLLYLIGYLIGAIKVKELFDVSREGMTEMSYIEPAIVRIKEIKNAALQEGKDTDLSSYDIEFKNVSFAYNKDAKVLKDVSFTAKQGEVTALVGISGSGKTSVLRLISRLYDYDTGSILIDGKDIKNISTESLFKNVSIVFQDVTLFNTSIMENIRLGRESATDEEVKEAARLANCMDFIEKLPDGFNTLIGENGAELSGGERQRISIARAFLKDAPVLILDEISASLDVDNEKKIQDSLNKLIKDKTVIIISHRLKSIENVNKIVVIDEGVVETSGNHDELIKDSKVYKNLIEKTKLAEAFNY
ncbi:MULTISPECIES: ABC transporter ATP-binding protein [Lachnoanaerobaculum]|jgi:ABC transporter related protein|uniref:ABC transporter ATP-binding protein n=1 Tax=Lachnoanaerobaculum umeaense TaxID=617123 RepID=A0A385PZH6_9FIRM|nr:MULTISPECIES: ABC transporter ATP-binding protein [Lachnoanaerobaculum]AYA98774.1 ABC transporter ATP-binding protein [Lachnoanaerobaculum umeaense]EJP19405.1 ABC transporter, ATP-binding protein [Lachnoanaerobaculum sp. ICM7]MBS6729340.1 ABC transporter ATP-binding protein [Lachnospiraceae bacterium oral taxon 082]PZX00021.1 ATP-binding cassette subfamily B protein [Lachnoanaerobaculum umeaense]